MGISTLLSEGIGDTVRVSLTEDPEAEIPVARYLAARYGRKIVSSMTSVSVNGRKAVANYDSPSRETLLSDVSCDFGKRLLDKTLDELELTGTYVDGAGNPISIQDSGIGAYLVDELMPGGKGDVSISLNMWPVRAADEPCTIFRRRSRR